MVCRLPQPHKMGADRANFSNAVKANGGAVKINFHLLPLKARKFLQDGNQFHFIIH